MRMHSAMDIERLMQRQAMRDTHDWLQEATRPRFSIEKRELLVRGHPLRKIEEPSRCCRIQSWTPGDRRQIFRSRQGFQINKILVRAQCLVFLERYLAAFLNTR